MKQFTTTLTCPYCNELLSNAATVTPYAAGHVRKGQLFVCFNCEKVSIVGDASLQLLTEDAAKKLPEQTIKQLAFVKHQVRKMKAEQPSHGE